LALAESPDPALLRIKEESLEGLGRQACNPLARNWYLSEAAEIRPSGAVQRPRISYPAIAQLPIEHMMHSMASRVNRRAARLRIAYGFDFIDTQKQFTLTIREGVGEVAETLLGRPDLILRITEHDFRALAVDEPWRLIQNGTWRRLRLITPETSLLSSWLGYRRLRLLAKILDRP
jgi:alkyl sulfatase BDS1-like metallo-beta-lactamase superfamily hydrolase